MKNSRLYAQKVGKFYRSLNRRYPKVECINYQDPVDAVIYAILSENKTEAAAQSVGRKFAEYFADLNDLRISRLEEIVEVLGKDNPVNREIASRLSMVLFAIFNQYNTISLRALDKMGKRPARQVLEKLPGISNFVINYCMLTSLQAHAIPLTKTMIEHLKTNELVESQADEQQIEGFLGRQISAKDAYEFYVLLRRDCEAGDTGREKKTTRKRESKSKTKTGEETNGVAK